MLSAGAAFLLAFQPSSLVTQASKRALTEVVAGTDDPKLRHAVEFARKALGIEDRVVAGELSKLDARAQKAGIALPAAPKSAGAGAASSGGSGAGAEIDRWLTAIGDAVRPALKDPGLAEAWSAGEAARDAVVAAGVAAHVAYLRSAVPGHARLASEAAARAAALNAALDRLDRITGASARPMVAQTAGTQRSLVAGAPDLANASDDKAFRGLNELTRDLTMRFESLARAYDVAPPADASAPPTARERALIESILANPDYDPPRRELAELTAARNDARGELIREQFAARDARAARRTTDESRHQARARELILSHPAWAAPLTERGARDVTFDRGFPDGVTMDAADFISRGAELLGLAPLTTFRLRKAAGQVQRLAATPVLARVAGLDLAEQGVTDDDVAALAASPYAARLRFLDLRHNKITERGIEAIAASPHLRNLETVELDFNPGFNPVDSFDYHDETHRHRVPTDSGKLLEGKYGPLRWLHPPDPE